MAVLFDKASKFTPGGVHSPVRTCSQVGAKPLFWQSASGSYLLDVDNNKYLDYICGFGPVILGHNPPEVVKALSEQLNNGVIYGGCYYRSPELSELICSAFVGMDKIRLMNSGTEACMTAIRLARAHTNKDKVIKCKGSYHGHSDGFLVNAGSGALTVGKPSSSGVTKASAADTLLAPFNDLLAVERLLEEYVNQVAAIIIEPVCGNMGMILPVDGYLQGLRALCDKYNVCLIFDEVMTGFRVAYGGAQVHYNVVPDLTVLGKIIGGGLPIGAVGGRQDIMDLLSPVGGVYQAGTFSANPMTITAGLVTLQILAQGDIYQSLNNYAQSLFKQVGILASKYNIDLQTNALGGMLGLFFTKQTIVDLDSVATVDLELFSHCYRCLLKHGVLIPPSAYEAWFVTIEHKSADIALTLSAFEEAFSSYRLD